jgi:hypothetical protein
MPIPRWQTDTAKSIERFRAIADSLYFAIANTATRNQGVANMPISSPFSMAKRHTLARLSALSVAPWFPADTLIAATIHALPRQALVIGNGAYADAPLANPANDANAIGAELKRLGFSLELQVNAKREVMENAIRAFSASLAKNNAVGLFYFAGHGLQLDWRNYLVPTDARLDKVADVLRQTVDMGTLLTSLGKAGNPMNIVVLDACRDNPFDSDQRTGKGLSQMDAPIGTLLAYATAPGNVASDGSGKNGLYTEHLLKEMSTPEAKLEDVFKRVRLAVRRSSQGQQIPWESTSLEEDFYFIPPANLKRLSEEELERLFVKEKALWEKAKTANTPAALAGYLQQYPSGRFAELAQAILDQLLAKQGEKKIRIANSAMNPYTKGSASAGKFRIGDRFTFRVEDHLTKLEIRRYTQIVTAITDGEVIFNNGRFVTDRLGSARKNERGERWGDNQFYAAEYSVGKSWSTRFDHTYGSDGKTGKVYQEFRVVGREHITVPAGTFSAFRVEASGWAERGSTTLAGTYWIAPDETPLFVAYNQTNRNRWRLVNTDRIELVSFSPGQ